jgi:hypothetical protein
LNAAGPLRARCRSARQSWLVGSVASTPHAPAWALSSVGSCAEHGSVKSSSWMSHIRSFVPTATVCCTSRQGVHRMPVEKATLVSRAALLHCSTPLLGRTTAGWNARRSTDSLPYSPSRVGSVGDLAAHVDVLLFRAGARLRVCRWHTLFRILHVPESLSHKAALSAYQKCLALCQLPPSLRIPVGKLRCSDNAS